MNIRSIAVDFSKKVGKIKMCHGMPEGPRRCGVSLSHDISREFSEIGTPAVRLHDIEYPYGSNQFVDIHCIFPDFSQDAELPESYNFAPTDAYIGAIKEIGAEPIFRLGESTDLFPRKLYTKTPENIEKWASICEHIVMHYNEGFADGFKNLLKRVEICGAADDARVFSGEKNDFFELYRVTACKLKAHFPKLKVGGYGSGGFYAMNRLNSTEEQKKYVPFMRDFLKYISAKETSAPLDFFTWYSYPASPEELLLHARYARSILNEYDFRRTQSVVCGYNTLSFFSDDISQKPSYAAELAALISALQRSDVDMAFISDSPICASHGKSFIRAEFDEACPIYHVLLMLGELYKLGTCVEVSGDSRGELYTMGATNGERHAVMLVCRAYSGNIELRFNGISSANCKIRRIASRGGESLVSAVSGELKIVGERVMFRVDRDAVYLIEFV